MLQYPLAPARRDVLVHSCRGDGARLGQVVCCCDFTEVSSVCQQIIQHINVCYTGGKSMYFGYSTVTWCAEGLLCAQLCKGDQCFRSFCSSIEEHYTVLFEFLMWLEKGQICL